MLRDLRKLGLINLDILHISQTVGVEFFVHLRKPDVVTPIDDESFYATRHQLLTAISQRLGAAPYRLSAHNKRRGLFEEIKIQWFRLANRIRYSKSK